MTSPGAGALAALLVIGLSSACGDPSPRVMNPYPEGRDTVELEALEVVHSGRSRSAEEGGSVEIVAFDISPDGVLAAADAEGLVTVRHVGEDPMWTVRVEGVVEGSPQISAVAVLEGGAVAVREAREGHVRVLGEGGRELAAWRVTPGRTTHGRDALLAIQGGELMVGLRPELTPEDPPIRFPRPVYERVSAFGEPRDTLWVGSGVTRRCAARSESRFRAGWFEDIRVRYVPKPQWGVGRDGSFVYGCPAEYSFVVERPDGGRLEVSRSWRPHAVTEQEREAFVRLWTVQMNVSGMHEEWSWPDDASLPPLKPAYGRILVADGGRIWVWPAQASEPVTSPPDWPLAGLPRFIWAEADEGAFDVFDEGGALVGHVRLPGRIPFTPYPDTPDPVIRGDTVWAVSVSQDVYAIERLRVLWK